MSIITLQYCCNATTIRDATQSVHEWCPLGRILWPSGTRPKRRLFLELFTTPTIDDDDVSQVVQHPPRVIVCVLLEPRNCLSSSSVTTASHSEWPEFPCQEISLVLVLFIILWPAGKSFAYNILTPPTSTISGQCNYNNNNNCNHNAPSQFSHTTPRLFAGQLQSHYCC